MPIARKFLDWCTPALPAAADFFVATYQSPARLDLGGVVAVVPGGRAGRQLLEVLVQRAEDQTLVLNPPRIVTVGALPELLYRPKRPFASDLVQKLAWVHVLRSLGAKRLARVIPQLPHDDDVIRWLDLGEMLQRQHRELAADGLDFQHVAAGDWKVAGAAEKERWQVLRKAQEGYLKLLDKHGLWDLQTARLFAIEHRECRLDGDVVLVATADMNRATRQMLDQVADRVTALVHAPDKLAHRFDEHGCLLHDEWRHAAVDLKPEQIHVVDGPADQAQEVARILTGFNGRYRADEISIGVPDEKLVPQIQRQLTQCDIPSRWVVGRRLPDTAPHRLLAAVADYLADRRTDKFAALVRHADVVEWLARQNIPPHWLTQFDEYYNVHLPPHLGEWLGDVEDYVLVQQVHAAVERWLQPLNGAARKLAEWSPPILQTLLAIFDGVSFSRDEPAGHFVSGACRTLCAAIREQESTPPQLAPTLTAREAIQLLLEQVANEELAPLADADAVELLGWLELPLDDAPALIVTSFNEGLVPTSLNSDLFLPNDLRRRLGLLDNSQRYARDAYALGVLMASRKEVALIVGRRDKDGEPLIPSRLLFATDPETIAARALDFFDHGPADAPAEPAGSLVATREQSAFIIRKPAALDRPLRSIGVTAFRSYLACPYRFYLRHVLRLNVMSDRVEELEAPAFGNLVHDVLKMFGRSELRNSTDAPAIRKFLHDALHDRVAAQYDGEYLAPVTVQLMQLRLRLDAFADWQANWASQGWTIAHTEVPDGRQPVKLAVDDRSIGLDGRIDRIDRHIQTGQWIIFDYKSSDTAHRPERTHQDGSGWIDLQLPLYRHLARSLGIDGPVRLGYIVLPKDTSKVGEQIAQWTDDELADADEVAYEVVRNVLDQKFWPPTMPPPRILGEFAPICQDNTFDRFQPESEAAAPLAVAKI